MSQISPVSSSCESVAIQDKQALVVNRFIDVLIDQVAQEIFESMDNPEEIQGRLEDAKIEIEEIALDLADSYIDYIEQLKSQQEHHNGFIKKELQYNPYTGRVEWLPKTADPYVVIPNMCPSSEFIHLINYKIGPDLLPKVSWVQDPDMDLWVEGMLLPHLAAIAVPLAESVAVDVFAAYATYEVSKRAKLQNFLRSEYAKTIEFNLADFAPPLSQEDTVKIFQQSASFYFKLGNYKRAAEYFQKLDEQDEVLSEIRGVCITEFSLGFTKGLVEGLYDSGKGLMLFLAEFIAQPVHTSKQLIQSVSGLVELSKNEDWDRIAQMLFPEICELVNQWEMLPSGKKGELVGYAIGKYGGDIFIPGAAAKIAAKGIENTKKLVAVSRSIKGANDLLALETAAKFESETKLAHAIKEAEQTAHTVRFWTCRAIKK